MDQHGIKCSDISYDHLANSKGRAPELRIQGFSDVSKLLAVMKPHLHLFKGVKHRDFLIMESLCAGFSKYSQNRGSQEALGWALGLKKSMHKASSVEADLQPKGSVSRAEYESRFGLAKGSSSLLTITILQKIDQAYKTHCEFIRKLIRNNFFGRPDNHLPREWLAGVVAGDGYFGSMFRPSDGGRSVQSYVAFSISMEANSLLMLQLIAKRFNVKTIQNKLNKATNQVTSHLLLERNFDKVLEIIFFLAPYPYLGSVRYEEALLVDELLAMKVTGASKRKGPMLKYVTKVYTLSDKLKGPERTLSLQDIKKLIIRLLPD